MVGGSKTAPQVSLHPTANAAAPAIELDRARVRGPGSSAALQNGDPPLPARRHERDALATSIGGGMGQVNLTYMPTTDNRPFLR